MFFIYNYHFQIIPTFLWTFLLINILLATGSFILFSNISMPIIAVITNLYMTTCVIGYANHLNTPLNIFTLTIILLGSQFGIQQMAKNF